MNSGMAATRQSATDRTPRSLLRTLAGLLLAGLLLALGAGAQPAPEPPIHVLLITVDTLRPDALGWVKSGNSTPVIDALAAGGFGFPSAVSPAPVTQPTHASIFTGLLPRRHGVRDNGQVLSSEVTTLAERLGQIGYETGAFISGHPLAAGFGFEQGFGHYDDQLAVGTPGRLERPAAETTRAALEWLQKAAGSPSPWFLWIHYWDPHDPYTPPPGFERPARPTENARDATRRAYLGEVAYVDRMIGDLLHGLATDGDSRPILTVFAADHGESLGEHGEQTHGFFIYESTVAVPLIFNLPGRIVASQSTAAARLIDIAPTVLDLLGQPPLEDVDGISLAGLLTGESLAVPPTIVESRRPWLSYGWSPLRAVRDGTWKLIAAPRPELYDLERDPGEATNLLDRERGKARELAAILKQAEQKPAASSQTSTDAEALARLRALGYTGAGASAGEPPPGVADPKDRVDEWNALSQAMERFERGDLRGAVAGFDEVLAKDPDNPFALSRSGAALIEARDFAAAAERLGRAARLRPADAETRSALAVALNRLGRHAEATEHWLELVRLQPQRSDAWINLSTSLGRSGKTAEAIRALGHAVELVPERADLRIRLAIVQHSAGNPKEAVRHMRLAAEQLGPQAFPHSGALGLMLLRAGQTREAAEWLARSRPTEGEFAEARFELARLRAAAGDPQTARRELELALRAAPQLRARAEADPNLADLVPTVTPSP